MPKGASKRVEAEVLGDGAETEKMPEWGKIVGQELGEFQRCFDRLLKLDQYGHFWGRDLDGKKISCPSTFRCSRTL